MPCFCKHDTGRRYFGSIEKKVIRRYFSMQYFRNICGVWVYTEKFPSEILIFLILKAFDSFKSIWREDFLL